MSRRAASFTQTDVQRAIKAAQACGMPVHKFEIGVDGKIVVYAGEPASALTVASDPYEEWKAKRDARRA